MFDPSSATAANLFTQPQAEALPLTSTLGVDATNSHALIFVDQRVANYQQLVGSATAEVILLNTHRSGLAQISEALAGREDISALHILSHGSEGDLLLGQGVVAGHNLETYSQEIMGWASALEKEADILLYGCNVAGSTEGVEFVQRLGELSGADVAASDDLTGAAALGADWELEVETGAIEAEMPWSQLMAASYSRTLQTIIVTDTGDVTDANDGVLTLREAIDQAVAGDVITFDGSLNGATVTLTQAELAVSKSLTIDGDLNGDGKADITVTRAQAGSAFRIFEVLAGSGTNITLEGLAITGGDSGLGGGGIYVTGDGGTVVLRKNTVSNNSSDARAGGLYVQGNSGTITLSNNTANDNNATTLGGGLYIEGNGGTIVLSGNTTSNNSSDSGSGLYIKGNGATITFSNNTVSNNFSNKRGGGLYIKGDSGTIALGNNTVSGNSSGVRGGGFYVKGDGGSVTLSNNIVSGNSSSSGRELYLDGSLGSGNTTHNLFGHTNDSGVSNNGVSVLTLGPNDFIPGGALNTIFVVDGDGKPLLTNNGGLTQTIALAENSPAINAANTNASATDQRGFNRVGIADVGAFEFGATAPEPPTEAIGVGGRRPTSRRPARRRPTLSLLPELEPNTARRPSASSRPTRRRPSRRRLRR